MATRWLGRGLIAASMWILSTAGAWALPLAMTVVAQGIVASNSTYGCPTGSVGCMANKDASLSAAAAATGTISINAAGTLATIALNVASVSFTGTPTTTFTGVTYTGSVPVINYGGDNYQQNLGSGTILGTASGIANLLAFSSAPRITGFSCTVPGGSGQCAVTFGSQGFTNVAGRDWSHQFNLTMGVPEPVSALLVALGVAGLLIRNRVR